MEAVQIETTNRQQTVQIAMGEDETPLEVVRRMVPALGAGNIVRIRDQAFLVQSVRPPIIARIQDDEPRSEVRESQHPKVDWFGDGYQPDPLPPLPEPELPPLPEPEAPQEAAERDKTPTLRPPGPHDAFVGSVWLPRDPRRKQIELTVASVDGEQLVMHDGRKIQVARLCRYRQVGLPAEDSAG